MKIIDSNFKDIDQYSGSEFETWYNTTVSYLQQYIQDESVITDMLMDNDRIIIQKTDGESYTILTHKNEYRRLRFRGDASAFKTQMVTRIKDNMFGAMSGIALRPNYNKHAFIHELLHALSSTSIHEFDENGVATVKIGTKVVYVDKNMDFVEGKPISSDGLNEGITEALTSFITNEYTAQYPLQTAVGALFITSNSLALNAYFSHDVSRLEAFYTDLEEKQNIITREDLINFKIQPTTDELDAHEELVAKIMAGAIAYNKAYNQDFDEQLYSRLISNMDEGYMLETGGSWRDLIATYQTGMGSMS